MTQATPRPTKPELTVATLMVFDSLRETLTDPGTNNRNSFDVDKDLGEVPNGLGYDALSLGDKLATKTKPDLNEKLRANGFTLEVNPGLLTADKAFGKEPSDVIDVSDIGKVQALLDIILFKHMNY